MENDIESIKMKDKDPIEELKGLDTGLRVFKYESHYFISCCYWNRFSGLIRDIVEIEIRNGKVKQFFDVANEELYVYEYGRGLRL